ncbi:Beta-glucuronidase [Paramyrothecium foliicola]|nr:Beta-glucuronidase [Paramyrothecium foliicola]
MVLLTALIRALGVFASADAALPPTAPEARIVCVPEAPQLVGQVIDASFQSFSIAFFAYAEYSSNASFQLLEPIKSQPGPAHPKVGQSSIKVRVGGSSQAELSWVPNQEQGMIGYYKYRADKTYNVTLGPALFDLFDACPKDTEFTLGLPCPWDNKAVLPSVVEIVKRAYAKLGPRLIGLELGKERNSLNLPTAGEGNKILVAGTLHAPTLIKCPDPSNATTCTSVTTLFEHGIDEEGIVAYANTHQLRLDVLCISLLRANDIGLVHGHFGERHNNTAFFVDSHRDLAADSVARGVPYVLGETNSLFGHGTFNVFDTFTAALWNIDYALYSTQTNISCFGFHQCFGWRYSAWHPIPAFGYLAGVLPSYYAYAHCLRHYESAAKKLSSMIAINLLDWSSTNRTPIVHRLTAAGADIKDRSKITFEGQHLDKLQGAVKGRVRREKLEFGNTVTLKASEAVLVSLT